MRRIECFKALFTFFLIASMLILGVGCEKGSKKAVVSQSVAQVDERFINNASLPSLFQNGLMAVANDGKYGFLDENYQPVGKLEFDYCTRFSEDIAVVAKRKEATKELSYAYVDKNLNYITDFEFSDAEAFSEGLAAVKKDDKWGYINKKGEFITDCKFLSANDFSEGLAKVQLDKNHYGFIDTNGELALDCGEIFVEDFSEGLAPAKFDGLWGYINTKGEWIREPEFLEAFPFSGGTAKVGKKINNKKHTTLIGKDGKELFYFTEGDINAEFSDGLAYKSKDGKYGYIGLDKKWKIDPQFSNARSFSEGLAAVKKGEKWGYINKNGEWVIKPTFNFAREFSSGVAIVTTENGYACINRKGELISNLNYEATENSELSDFVGGYAIYSKYEINNSVLYDGVDAYGQMYGGPQRDYVFGIIDINGNDLTGYTLDYKPTLFLEGYIVARNGEKVQSSYSGKPLAEGYFIVRP